AHVQVRTAVSSIPREVKSWPPGAKVRLVPPESHLRRGALQLRTVPLFSPITTYQSPCHFSIRLKFFLRAYGSCPHYFGFATVSRHSPRLRRPFGLAGALQPELALAPDHEQPGGGHDARADINKQGGQVAAHQVQQH